MSKSKRYTIISSFPTNLYISNSPVLVCAGALLNDNKTDDVLVQLKFKNLSEYTISAMKIGVVAKDVSGILLEGVEEYQYLDLSVSPQESYGDDKAIKLPDINTRACTVIIKEVLFSNEVAWKNESLTEYSPIPSQTSLADALADSDLVEQYKRDTSAHSKYKPLQYLDLWLCSCGTANKHQSKTCSGCNMELQQLLDAINLDRLIMNREVYQAQQDRKVKERRQVKKKILRIGTVGAVCVFLVIIFASLFTRVIEPAMKYNAANQLLEKGRIEEAISAFEALEGYKDCDMKIFVCKMAHLKQAEVGDYILFGTYEQDNDGSNGKEDIEWLVLAKDEDRILVISKYALDSMDYHSKRSFVTWEDSDVRQWLNNNFLHVAFTDAEKSIIPVVTVEAHKNPKFIGKTGVNGNPGNDTHDKVFLLSIEEAQEYFATDNERICQPTEYAKTRGQRTGSENTDWWLRTPGAPDYDGYTSYIKRDGSIAYDGVQATGYPIFTGEFCIRPALWIDLNVLGS